MTSFGEARGSPSDKSDHKSLAVRREVDQERRRIASELHDRVIQKLFCTGMSLQSLAARGDDSETAAVLRKAMADIDDTITEVRSVIHQLRTEPTPAIRPWVLEIVEEVRSALGFEPAVTFSGPADDLIAGPVAEQLTSTLREALLNVARHAEATGAAVRIDADHGRVVLEVLDNGLGYPGPRTGGLGIYDMQGRAESLGGFLTIEAAEPGTRLRWSVPVEPVSHPHNEAADEPMRS